MYKGIRTWNQLRAQYKLKEVLAAVERSDKARAYYKACIERRAAILAKAKKAGLLDEDRSDWNFNPPARAKRVGAFRRILYLIFKL